MADIATLGLRIDATGAIKGIDETGQRLVDLGKKAAGVAKAAGAALGAGIVAGTALVVKNTLEAEAAFSQLEARVKSTGGVAGFTADELAAISGELQNVTTYGDDAIQSMQSVLLTFTQVRGEQFTGATEAVLNMATALGTDLQSAALQVGKALNDPVAGVGALSRAGVQLSESQKQAIADMVEMGDVAGAQSVILAELETQFGGAATAARNTLGGALAALKNAFGDLFEVPGLITPITTELNRLVGFLSQASTVDAVKAFIKDSVTAFLVFGSTIADVVGVVATSLGQLAGFFGRLSGQDSPLNKFARGMDSVANGAAAASVKMESMAQSVAQADVNSKGAAPAMRDVAYAAGEIAEQSEEAAKQAAELQSQLERLPTLMAGLTRGNTAAGGGGVVEIFGPVTEQILTGRPIEVSAVPSQTALTAWQDFSARIGLTLSQTLSAVTTNLGDALLNTFSRIAQRGKATIGDIFATLGQTGLGAGVGGQILGAASIVVDFIGAARARYKAAIQLVKDQMDALSESFESFGRMFTPTVSKFGQDMQRIADFVTQSTADIDAILTKTARRALGRAGGDAETALAGLLAQQASGQATNLQPAIDQLRAYIAATNDLREAQREATEAAIRAAKQRRADLNDDLQVRRLAALGRNEEAEALRRRIQQEKEFQETFREFGPIMAGIVLSVQAMEDAAIQAAKEAEKARTLMGLDAEIARASGNEEEARRIEREMILLDITDETIRARYEELWAIQDATRAQQEAAEAAELLYQQQLKMEDLEVRRLIATGNTMEAEKLRFDLQQQRELRQAEKDFAMGLITEEIYEKLKEILGLEADAFAQQQAAGVDGVGGGVSGVTGGRTDSSQQAVGSIATAQVQDIDRVVGELTTIRIRAGQLVQLMTRLVNGGGIMGAVNAGLQASTEQQRLYSGDVVVA